MGDQLEDRILALEDELSKLKEQASEPKPKDNWDKLSALSTLLSGVIIASIGIWVNHSLTVGQQLAQDAQARATTAMEKAHNDAAEKQADQALKLQDAQAANSLAFQKQQALDQKELEKLRIGQQRQQANDALIQQREHDAATLKLQQAQLAKEFIPQLEAGSRSRAAALQLLESVNPSEALTLSVLYAETSGDASLRQTSETVILNLQKSDDPVLSKAASEALVKVSIAKRIQAISNVFHSGKAVRDYGEISKNALGELTYGGFFSNGEGLYQLIGKYCGAAGAQKASAFAPYLSRIKDGDPDLATDPVFKDILREAATDIVMQETQDDIFERLYWRPVQVQASSLGLKLPLSIAVLYDTAMQSGIDQNNKMALSIAARLGGNPKDGVDEKAWVPAFLSARLDYLQTFANRLSRNNPTIPFMKVWKKRVNFFLGLPPWLRQTVKTLLAVRCENLDRQDHCIAF